MTLEQAVQTIAIFQPKSIFLYGSQARGDVTSDSDVEIGVIVDTYTSLSRQQLKEAVNDPSYSIYPFNLSELLSYSIDTPFQKHFYLYELIVSAKTLYGEPIIERLSLPKISLLDALQDTRFNL
jgi:predicted nucleotidyltransferase